MMENVSAKTTKPAEFRKGYISRSFDIQTLSSSTKAGCKKTSDMNDFSSSAVETRKRSTSLTSRIIDDYLREESTKELNKKEFEEAYQKAATALAKQLLLLRKQKTKNISVSTKLSGVGYQVQAMQSTAAMGGAMSTASKTMAGMNAQMNPQQLQKTLQNFERESAKMDLSEEIMNEGLDSVLDDSGDEEEQEAIVNQVLDEIGIDIAGKMADAPSAHNSKIATGSKPAADQEIEDMLAKLKA
ncbi:hypothetical protein QZH41_011332 [Actinostola sp. cb2023]|nr:hypothetical protein QZH41_011332 [Actinostola sp. cb2023]